MTKTKSGFTIVELLIVIVVIAILAAISVAAYVGTQQRARDSQRKQDIAALQKALELYYVDNNRYPPSSSICTSSSGDTLANGWATTADKDGCWSTFLAHLKPYMNDQTLLDPKTRTAINNTDWLTSTNYSITTYYCTRQTYVIYYHTEISRPSPFIEGSAGGCSTLSHAAASATRHVIVHSKVQ